MRLFEYSLILLSLFSAMLEEGLFYTMEIPQEFTWYKKYNRIMMEKAGNFHQANIILT